MKAKWLPFIEKSAGLSRPGWAASLASGTRCRGRTFLASRRNGRLRFGMPTYIPLLSARERLLLSRQYLTQIERLSKR